VQDELLRFAATVVRRIRFHLGHKAIASTSDRSNEFLTIPTIPNGTPGFLDESTKRRLADRDTRPDLVK
jgi:hypothetical protein